MAAATVGAELAIVHVVRFMAVAAASTQSCHRFQILTMTTLAADTGVCAAQRKICLQIVVESPLVPTDRVVARGAIALKTTMVWIVLSMAVHTGVGGVLKNLCFMTRVAFLLGVQSEQGELRQVMVEEHIVGPRGLVVTVLTLHALSAEMWIVIFVAGIAAR